VSEPRAENSAAVEALRRALASGSFEQLAELYSEDALLDANLRGGRRRARGRGGIAAVLSGCWSGPGELTEFSARAHAGGLELWVERVGAEGPSRTRQYAWLEGGLIARHWIYTAPPRTLPPGTGLAAVSFDPRLFDGLGEVVEHDPLVSIGWSGNALERVVLADGRKLIAKRIVPGAAWIDRHTRDQGREGLLVTSGVLGRLDGSIDHAAIGAVRDGDAWWVLMRDVSERLLPDGKRLSRGESRTILRAANTMWEEFWGEQVPHVSSLVDCLGLFSPAIAAAERDGLDLLPKQYEVFWEAFAEAVDDDVAEGVLGLHEDSSPLVARLESLGTTLIHADIRDEQLGLDGDRVVLLDWGRATQGHPVVDFAWSICHNAWRIDAAHDELVDDFRRVRGDHDDERANGLIGVVGLMMYGWVFGHSAAYHPDPAERRWASEELAWWVPQARQGLEVLA
jgi:Phosphotransferase enzyme family